MRPGRYAADDGSFARSAGGAGLRGLVLLAVALVIGVVLLNATDAEPPGTNLTARTSNGSADSGDEGGDAKVATTTTVAPTTTIAARAPKDVKVIVANASEVKGAAAKANELLKPPGYNVLSPTNAPTTKDTSVYFTPGYDRDAGAIAQALQFPATSVKPLPAPSPVTDAKGANVVVILGTDQASRFGATASGSTTTAKPGSTTTTARAGATTTTTAVATTTTKP